MKIYFGFKCETLLTSRDIVKTDGPFDVLLAQRELVSRFMRDCHILRENLVSAQLSKISRPNWKRSR